MTTHFEFPKDAQDAIATNLGESPTPASPIPQSPEKAAAFESLLRQHVSPHSFQRTVPPEKVRARIVDSSKPQVDENRAQKQVPIREALQTPVSGADGISVDLPSRFFYYPFKDLYVKPLRVPQLAKIAKAHETGSLQTQLEAISTLLYTPNGDTDLAFKLTTADYTAVLYWLRLNSFPKPTLRVTSICQNEKHHEDVKAGIKTQASLEIETVVTRSDMRTVYLDNVPDPDRYFIEVDGIRIPLGPETMKDTVDFLNHPDWADEEFSFLSRRAAVIKLDEATGKQWNWDQRVQFVREYVSVEQFVLIDEFAEMVDDYGMVETAETRCKGCGSKGVVKLTCDPLTFLSPKF